MWLPVATARPIRMSIAVALPNVALMRLSATSAETVGGGSFSLSPPVIGPAQTISAALVGALPSSAQSRSLPVQRRRRRSRRVGSASATSAAASSAWALRSAGASGGEAVRSLVDAAVADLERVALALRLDEPGERVVHQAPRELLLRLLARAGGEQLARFDHPLLQLGRQRVGAVDQAHGEQDRVHGAGHQGVAHGPHGVLLHIADGEAARGVDERPGLEREDPEAAVAAGERVVLDPDVAEVGEDLAPPSERPAKRLSRITASSSSDRTSVPLRVLLVMIVGASSSPSRSASAPPRPPGRA